MLHLYSLAMTVGKPKPIKIITGSAGKPDTPCKVQIITPTGKKRDVPTKEAPDGYTASVVMQEPGPHKVVITYVGKEVPGSPFKVNAVPDVSGKVKAYGPGLKGGVANKPATFTIDAREANKISKTPGDLGVTVDGPAESKITSQEKPDGTVDVTYTPKVPGDYKVNVTYNEAPIPGSPFKAKITPDTSSKVKAYGPGLKGGQANKPATFTIDAREANKAAGTPGDLGVTVDGPKESKIESKEKPDGTVDVTYTPTVPGDYTVNVTYNETPIPQAPFKAKITPDTAAKVKAYGPGLEGGTENQPATFTVDTREAQKELPKGAPKPKIDVTVDGPSKPAVQKKDMPDGTTEVTYTPQAPGDYKVNVTCDESTIPKAPFTAKIKPDLASKVKAFGPGLEGGTALKPATFTIDSRDAQMALPKGSPKPKVNVTVDGPSKPKVERKPKPDGTEQVTYTPTAPGDYKVNVTCEESPIPGAPFTAKVVPADVSELVKVYGPGLKGGVIKKPATFTIDAREANRLAPSASGLGVTINGPAESQIQSKENPDGTIQVTYTPESPGEYAINVSYDEKPVKDSPFKAKIVVPGLDVSGVKVSGPGLAPEGNLLVLVFCMDDHDANNVTIKHTLWMELECSTTRLLLDVG